VNTIFFNVYKSVFVRLRFHGVEIYSGTARPIIAHLANEYEHVRTFVFVFVSIILFPNRTDSIRFDVRLHIAITLLCNE